MSEAKNLDSGADDSALSKKVKSVSFDITLFPHLDSLSKFIGRVCSTKLAEAASVATKPLSTKISMMPAVVSLSGLLEDTSYYWFGENSEDAAMLVGLSPNFLSALSEALLGGGFQMQEEASSPTALDSQLAQMFVEDMVTGIVGQLSETVNSIQPGGLRFVRAATSPKEVLNGVTTSALFGLGVEMLVEGVEISSALMVYFPVEFLERKGMLAPAEKSVISAGANTKWYADMLENVNQMEVPLPVSIAKYSMTLSELSKLAVDQLLPLEEGAQDKLDVTIKSDEGTFSICTGRLGTYKKNKAVKVMSEVYIV